MVHLCKFNELFNTGDVWLLLEVFFSSSCSCIDKPANLSVKMLWAATGVGITFFFRPLEGFELTISIWLRLFWEARSASDLLSLVWSSNSVSRLANRYFIRSFLFSSGSKYGPFISCLYFSSSAYKSTLSGESSPAFFFFRFFFFSEDSNYFSEVGGLLT